MREPTIAHNYAEVLHSLARKAENLDGWGTMLDEVVSAIWGDERLRRFLESPNVDEATKRELVGRAFADRMPRLMVRFLQALITHRRQMLLPEIAREYHQIVDAIANRVHAQVTVAREMPDAERDRLAASLSDSLGKTVVPHLVVNPEILGGVIVKVADRVMDGSVRRKLAVLRTGMLRGATA
ncbi:MAG TPA: F0F1 ATP synthase subunit delta [Gemmatimonadaceae bacterium]